MMMLEPDSHSSLLCFRITGVKQHRQQWVVRTVSELPVLQLQVRGYQRLPELHSFLRLSVSKLAGLAATTDPVSDYSKPVPVNSEPISQLPIWCCIPESNRLLQSVQPKLIVSKCHLDRFLPEYKLPFKGQPVGGIFPNKRFSVVKLVICS